MKKIIAGAFTLVLGCGCQSVDRTTQLMITDVIKPAVLQASSELAARSGQVMGQGSMIEPGMEVKGHFVFGTGVAYNFTIRLVGASANLALATQGDQGPDLKHATTQPTTSQPAP